MGHNHEDMLWRRDALEHVFDYRSVLLDTHPVTSADIDDLTGHVLAEPIVAETDQPPADYATMDGFAFDATDDYPLRIVGEVYPEDTPPSIDAGEAVRIATGAPLPAEANAVLKREEATETDGRLKGTSIDPGTYVYERGSNVERGAQLYDAGDRLSAKDALLLGDLGRSAVSVYEPFSVGVLATGTEIHEDPSRDLDSPMLAGLVRSWGHEATYEGTVADAYADVEDRIATLATDHDVVMTTGGTSVGHKDYVIRALESLGEVVFHRVRVRPGKPIALAHLPDYDAVAFAVPGKPIGAHVITSLVARPFFTGAAALPGVEATFARDVGLGPEGFEYAIPVTLDDGEAMPLGHVDSPLPVYDDTFDPSVLSSSTRAAAADGFVLTTTAIAAGESVTVTPYRSL